MNEHMAQVTLKNVNLEIQKAIFEIFNVARVITEEQNIFRYTFDNIILFIEKTTMILLQ